MPTEVAPQRLNPAQFKHLTNTMALLKKPYVDQMVEALEAVGWWQVLKDGGVVAGVSGTVGDDVPLEQLAEAAIRQGLKAGDDRMARVYYDKIRDREDSEIGNVKVIITPYDVADALTFTQIDEEEDGQDSEDADSAESGSE